MTKTFYSLQRECFIPKVPLNIPSAVLSLRSWIGIERGNLFCTSCSWSMEHTKCGKKKKDIISYYGLCASPDAFCLVFVCYPQVQLWLWFSLWEYVAISLESYEEISSIHTGSQLWISEIYSNSNLIFSSSHLTDRGRGLHWDNKLKSSVKGTLCTYK